MNYYEARQLSDKTGWHFTSMNDGRISPVGYCSPWQRCDDCEGHGCEKCEQRGIVKKHDYTDHIHATAGEAELCFYRYLMDELHEETYGDWTGCECCGEPTKQGLSQRSPIGTGFPLCDEHRTPEVLAGLTEPPKQIMASY